MIPCASNPCFYWLTLLLVFFFCLSTQAMQVKVQVKCMTCLFCPSIRGAGLWPPSALCSPWGGGGGRAEWMFSPGGAPGWLQGRQLPVKELMRALEWGSQPSLALSEVSLLSAPFPSCPLCSQHTNRNTGTQTGLVNLGGTPLLCRAGSDSLCPSHCTFLPFVQGSYDSKRVFQGLDSRIGNQQITMHFCTKCVVE